MRKVCEFPLNKTMGVKRLIETLLQILSITFCIFINACFFGLIVIV